MDRTSPSVRYLIRHEEKIDSTIVGRLKKVSPER